MGLRDILITLIVIGAIPFILQRPKIGIYIWSWLSYMNPHRLAYGFAYNMPFAQITAITLMVSLMVSRELRKPPFNTVMVLWVLFVTWMAITTAAAVFPDSALEQLIKVLKIQLVVLFTLLVIHGRQVIHTMVWVIYLSIGFFGIKGGIFAVMTGGGFRIWGPAGTFIEDNNSLAVANLMVIPLGYYLYLQSKNPWVKRGLMISMLLIALAVVASYSRGAFLAIIGVSFYLWAKSKNRLATALPILLLLPLLFLFMPQSWHDRISTIENYEEDASAMGRINAWQYSINVASARVTGAGFNSWSRATFAVWAPNANDVHAAHSIYFGALADHGWPGLLLFILIFLLSWRQAGRLAKLTKGLPEHAWINDLARMVQVSLVAYGTGGAFLSLAYFDLPWHLVAITLILQREVKELGLIQTKKEPFVQNLQQHNVRRRPA